MDRSSILLVIGLIIFYSVYLVGVVNGYLYNYLFLTLNLFALLSAAIFFMAYRQRNKEIKFNKKINIYLTIGIILFFILIIFEFIGNATIIALLGIIITGYIAQKKRLKSYTLYALVIVGMVLTTAISYSFLLNLRGGSSWKGIDEIAYNYYAANLTLQGKNPYASDMSVSLLKFNTLPTIQLNGSIEKAYNYPAISMLPTIILLLINVSSYMSFILIVGFISIIVSFFIYYKSGYNKSVLIPITIWLLFTFASIVTIDHYLSVAFLMLAYLFRKRSVVYGAFLGLAASTIQLAWFAIPFFLVLTLREEGKGKMFKSVIISVLVFLLINAYFIAMNPHAFFSDVFGLFATSKLFPLGPNIMNVFIKMYNVQFWVPVAVSIVALLAFLGLFYLYTETLRPLIALVPMFIFFLSWRNLIMYGFAFVPFIIMLCYLKEKERAKDLVKRKSYIAIVLLCVVIVSALLVFYGHTLYLKQNTLSINYVGPMLQLQGNGTYNLQFVKLNISNNGNITQPVSIIYVNQNPNVANFIVNSSLIPIAPHSSQNYTLRIINVTNIRNGSSFYISAFDRYYIIGKTIRIRVG